MVLNTYKDYLGIRGILVTDVAKAENGLLLDLAEDAEQGGLHPMALQRVFPGLLGDMIIMRWGRGRAVLVDSKQVITSMVIH